MRAVAAIGAALFRRIRLMLGLHIAAGYWAPHLGNSTEIMLEA
jgi:hypothetical protein